MGRSLDGQVAKFFARKIEADRLREKHRLTPKDLVMGPQEEIKNRVEAYQQDLDELLKKWRLEDGATET